MGPFSFLPPATNTRPSAMVMQVWPLREADMAGTFEKEPFIPNTSEVSREPDGPRPPVIITRPSGNTAAQAPLLADCILPLATQVPVADVSWGRYPCKMTVSARPESGRSTNLDLIEALRSRLRFIRNLADPTNGTQRFIV